MCILVRKWLDSKSGRSIFLLDQSVIISQRIGNDDLENNDKYSGLLSFKIL